MCFSLFFLLLQSCSSTVVTFKAQRPGKLSISNKIKKVFIDPTLIQANRDRSPVSFRGRRHGRRQQGWKAGCCRG